MNDPRPTPIERRRSRPAASRRGDGLGVTGPVQIVLVAIFVFVIYVTWDAYADGREARYLADLGPCGLAQAYADGRLAPADGDVASEDADQVDQRHAAFAHAARLVVAGSGSAVESTLVERLRALTSQGLDGASAASAPREAFLAAFGEACPVEFEAWTERLVP